MVPVWLVRFFWFCGLSLRVAKWCARRLLQLLIFGLCCLVFYALPNPALKALFEMIVGGFFKLVCVIFLSIPLVRDLFIGPPPPPAPIEKAYPLLDQSLLVLLEVMFGVVLCMGVTILYLLNRKPKVLRPRNLWDESAAFVFESYREGSAYFNTPLPAFAAVVEIFRSGSWYPAGICYRTGQGVLTCSHVVNGAERIRLSNGPNVSEFAGEVFEHQEDLGDVALARIEVTWMKKAKVAKSGLSAGDRMMVMVHNGVNASMGPLSSDDVFGMVKYEGSTARGFSGSPYYMGNTVFGMHVGAGKVNLGYESGYLELSLQNESSEDYFLNIVRSGAKHKIRRSPFDPDEIMIKVRGRYVIVDEEEYYEALGRQEEPERFELPELDLEAAHGFQDSENCERPAAAQSAAGPSLTQEEAAPATSQPISFVRTLHPLPDGSQRVILRQEPTPAPRKLVSNSTLESTAMSEYKRLAAMQTSLCHKLHDLKTQLGIKSKKPKRPYRTVTSANGAATAVRLSPLA